MSVFRTRLAAVFIHGTSDGSECTFQCGTSSYQRQISASCVSWTSSYLHNPTQFYLDDSWEPRVLKIRLAASSPQGATYFWEIGQ